MTHNKNFISISSTDPPSTQPIVVHIDADIKELIPTFQENRRKDIQDLWSAYYHKNYSTIKTIAHRIKGIGGGYGFMAISEIGSALEQAIAQANYGYIADLIQSFEDYLDRVQIIYEEN